MKNFHVDATVVVVDDDSHVLLFLKELLEETSLDVRAFSDGLDALSCCQNEMVDLVVTDFMMPKISGLQMLTAINEHDSDIPVIIMTGHADLDLAVKAVKHRAFDLVSKPFQPEAFLEVVEKGLNARRAVLAKNEEHSELERMVRLRTNKLSSSLARMESMNREMIRRLCMAGNQRDDDSGNHTTRIGQYTHCLARECGLPETEAQTVALASTMHDIGKIGIPDSILFKEEPLTEEEFGIFQSHTTIGKRILDGSSFDLLDRAASIALNHHERWDGSGYPRGLRGTEIPLDSRIVALADQYDTLRSERPLRKGFSHERAVEIITQGDGKTMPEHFDPEVLSAFSRVAPQLDDIYMELTDLKKSSDLFLPVVGVDNVTDQQSFSKQIERLQLMAI